MTRHTSDTSGALVVATKVKGAIVFDLAGEKIGNVDHVMVDTTSGCALYAVMSFGNSPRRGRKYHSLLSLPWVNMKYDAQRGGYLVNLDKKVLEDVPDRGRSSWSDRTSRCDALWSATTAEFQDTRIRLV
jgi:hypothetical protein